MLISLSAGLLQKNLRRYQKFKIIFWKCQTNDTCFNCHISYSEIVQTAKTFYNLMFINDSSSRLSWFSLLLHQLLARVKISKKFRCFRSLGHLFKWNIFSKLIHFKISFRGFLTRPTNQVSCCHPIVVNNCLFIFKWDEIGILVNGYDSYYDRSGSCHPNSRKSQR